MYNIAGSVCATAAAIGGPSCRSTGRRLDGPQADAAVLRAARQQQLVSWPIASRPWVGKWAVACCLLRKADSAPILQDRADACAHGTSSAKSQLKCKPSDDTVQPVGDGGLTFIAGEQAHLQCAGTPASGPSRRARSGGTPAQSRRRAVQQAGARCCPRCPPPAAPCTHPMRPVMAKNLPAAARRATGESFLLRTRGTCLCGLSSFCGCASSFLQQALNALHCSALPIHMIAAHTRALPLIKFKESHATPQHAPCKRLKDASFGCKGRASHQPGSPGTSVSAAACCMRPPTSIACRSAQPPCPIPWTPAGSGNPPHAASRLPRVPAPSTAPPMQVSRLLPKSPVPLAPDPPLPCSVLEAAAHPALVARRAPSDPNSSPTDTVAAQRHTQTSESAAVDASCKLPHGRRRAHRLVTAPLWPCADAFHKAHGFCESRPCS